MKDLQSLDARGDEFAAPDSPAATPALGQAVPALGYRKDIDGLRAVAVALVLLYHGKLLGLTGGFVGVDVFFVISGYLITQIIVAKADRGAFSYRDFYTRRIRRLLPAYLVVLTATVAAGLVISFPRQLVDLGKSLVASGGFATNVLFWRQSGYFAGQAEIKPLLHTWSLSVEEQFYLFFPLLILLLRRLDLVPKRPLVIGAVLAFSLVLSEWLLSVSPAASFYLLPSRSWELALGALLALGRPGLGWPRAAHELMVGAGVLLIAFAALTLDAGSRFPGLNAGWACLGTALIIHSGDRSRVAAALLSTGPMVLLGQISYSLYLWHWPLFAFARYLSMDPLTSGQSVGLLAASVCLAWLTWKFVETPFRNPARTPRFRPFLATLAVSLASVGIGAALIAQDGLPGRFDRSVLALQAPAWEARDAQCMAGLQNWIDPAKACVLPAGAPRANVAVWGDSHAFSLVHAVADVAAEGGSGVRFFGYSGCPPVPGIRRTGNAALSRCTEWNTQVRELIASSEDIDTVVLVARHSAYLSGYTSRLGPAEGVGGLWFEAVDGRKDLEAVYMEGLDSLVADLTRRGKRVVLVYPVPEVGYEVPTTLAMRARWGGEVGFTRPRSNYDERQGDIRRALDGMAARHGAGKVDPAAILCDRSECRVMMDGQSAYMDNNHLSQAGAKLLSDQIGRAIRTREAPP